jgi:hypothetical protein
METKLRQNQIKVKFIDYGNEEWLEPEIIKDLKRQYTEMPHQALKCSLATAPGDGSNVEDPLACGWLT